MEKIFFLSLVGMVLLTLPFCSFCAVVPLDSSRQGNLLPSFEKGMGLPDRTKLGAVGAGLIGGAISMRGISDLFNARDSRKAMSKIFVGMVGMTVAAAPAVLSSDADTGKWCAASYFAPVLAYLATMSIKKVGVGLQSIAHKWMRPTVDGTKFMSHDEITRLRAFAEQKVAEVEKGELQRQSELGEWKQAIFYLGETGNIDEGSLRDMWQLRYAVKNRNKPLSNFLDHVLNKEPNDIRLQRLMGDFSRNDDNAYFTDDALTGMGRALALEILQIFSGLASRGKGAHWFSFGPDFSNEQRDFEQRLVPLVLNTLQRNPDQKAQLGDLVDELKKNDTRWSEETTGQWDKISKLVHDEEHEKMEVEADTPQGPPVSSNKNSNEGLSDGVKS